MKKFKTITKEELIHSILTEIPILKHKSDYRADAIIAQYYIALAHLLKK